MELKFGILALLEAKPGKEDEVASFLAGGRAIVEQEPGTLVWYAFRAGPTTFGIFDAFADEEGRQAHLNGQIPAALGQVGPDLLAADPDIRTVDVLAVKPTP
jgi:quinol monooxygenase YgiN